MRADSLWHVSQELRLPLTSIKGATATVLDARRAFGTTELVQFFRIVDDQADRMDGPYRRPARRRQHRRRHPVGRCRAVRRGRTHRRGARRVPVRRHGPRRGRRPAAGPAARDGRPRPFRPGARQPVLQRRPPRAAPDPGDRRARRRPRRAVGCRRGPRRRPGGAAEPVPQIRWARRGRGILRPRSRARPLQGHRRGAWRPDPRRERGTRQRHRGRLHPAGRGRRPAAAAGTRTPRRQPPRPRARRRRRPADAALRARSPRRDRIRQDGHG